MSLHPTLHAITERIVRRSAASRAAYLAGIDAGLRDGLHELVDEASARHEALAREPVAQGSSLQGDGRARE
mgnify:CR=1 FL=1